MPLYFIIDETLDLIGCYPFLWFRDFSEVQYRELLINRMEGL